MKVGICMCVCMMKCFKALPEKLCFQIEGPGMCVCVCVCEHVIAALYMYEFVCVCV